MKLKDALIVLGVITGPTRTDFRLVDAPNYHQDRNSCYFPGYHTNTVQIRPRLGTVVFRGDSDICSKQEFDLNMEVQIVKVYEHTGIMMKIDGENVLLTF